MNHVKQILEYYQEKAQEVDFEIEVFIYSPNNILYAFYQQYHEKKASVGYPYMK